MGYIVFVCFVVVMVAVFSIWIAIQRAKRGNRQANALKKVIELKEKGHHAEVCPKCDGRGINRYSWWGSANEKDCPRCKGLGYLYNIKENHK